VTAAIMPSVGKAATPAAPPAPDGSPQAPVAVPRSSPAPPPEPPPSDPYKTYNTLGPARPPKVPPKTADPEPAAAAPADPAAPAAAPQAAAPAPLPPVAERPAKPPRPPRRSPAAVLRDLDRRIYAILAAIVVGAALVLGIAVVGSKSKDKVPPEPTQAAAVVKPKKTAKPKPAGPALKTQAQQLDRLLQRSKTGRADAVNGDFKAAMANRANLLKDIQSLQGKATNAQVKAGATAFAAAIRESLRQNRECAAKCSSSDITRVGTLKRTAVDKLNPLLKRFSLGPYTAKEI
jgi:hypothetical protein